MDAGPFIEALATTLRVRSIYAAAHFSRQRAPSLSASGADCGGAGGTRSTPQASWHTRKHGRHNRAGTASREAPTQSGLGGKKKSKQHVCSVPQPLFLNERIQRGLLQDGGGGSAGEVSCSSTGDAPEEVGSGKRSNCARKTCSVIPPPPPLQFVSARRSPLFGACTKSLGRNPVTLRDFLRPSLYRKPPWPDLSLLSLSVPLYFDKRPRDVSIFSLGEEDPTTTPTRYRPCPFETDTTTREKMTRRTEPETSVIKEEI
ncbi:hypothetical protein MRX96_046714 [Rhipicephalus microplus]